MLEGRPVDFESSRTPELGLLWLVPVVATCGISLALLRSELVQVPYLNDSAMHEEMVRFALAKIRASHFPPDSWFPFLNLGSPLYLHYQSLAAMLTALFAWAIGVGRAFTLTTWLLVGCWPLCVYATGRLFGLRQGAAMAAAVLSPFVSSFTGVGYEQISYLWGGYGLWSQLWAMWTLPFAWALSWRAVEERRFVVLAAIAVAATAAFHFQTGYLAFAAVVVFVLARPSQLLVRAGRGSLVAGGAAALSAWALVPLVAEGRWAAVDQFLLSGPDANSYGAKKVLDALLTGDIFDWHHIVLITPLFLVGLVLCLYAWQRPPTIAAVGQGARCARTPLSVQPHSLLWPSHAGITARPAAGFEGPVPPTVHCRSAALRPVPRWCGRRPARDLGSSWSNTSAWRARCHRSTRDRRWNPCRRVHSRGRARTGLVVHCWPGRSKRFVHL